MNPRLAFILLDEIQSFLDRSRERLVLEGFLKELPESSAAALQSVPDLMQALEILDSQALELQLSVQRTRRNSGAQQTETALPVANADATQ
jgi:hypothetical protein